VLKGPGPLRRPNPLNTPILVAFASRALLAALSKLRQSSLWNKFATPRQDRPSPPNPCHFLQAYAYCLKMMYTDLCTSSGIHRHHPFGIQLSSPPFRNPIVVTGLSEPNCRHRPFGTQLSSPAFRNPIVVTGLSEPNCRHRPFGTQLSSPPFRNPIVVTGSAPRAIMIHAREAGQGTISRLPHGAVPGAGSPGTWSRVPPEGLPRDRGPLPC
jgi:hypothetical protein